ncbi:MAG: flippase-like domain-containing protein [Planctomycetes bacterium]|nr:flippase-like domain-containing protein [Planctomycetota bacterium]
MNDAPEPAPAVGTGRATWRARALVAARLLIGAGCIWLVFLMVEFRDAVYPAGGGAPARGTVVETTDEEGRAVVVVEAEDGGAHRFQRRDVRDRLTLISGDEVAATALREADGGCWHTVHVDAPAPGLSAAFFSGSRREIAVRLSRWQPDDGGRGEAGATGEPRRVTLRDGESLLLRPADLAPGGVRPDVRYGLLSLVRVPHPALLSGVLLLLAGSALVAALRWRLLLAGVGEHHRRREIVRVTFLGMFYNFVIPGTISGDVVKAACLVRRSESRARMVTSLVMDRFVGLCGLFLIGSAAMALFGRGDMLALAPPLYGVTLGTTLALAATLSRGLRRMLFIDRLLPRLGRWGAMLARVDGALMAYRDRARVVFAAIALTVVLQSASIAGAWLISESVPDRAPFADAPARAGLGLSVGEVAMVFPLATLISAVPLIPGGWGVGELVFQALLAQAGVARAGAVAFSLLYRACALLVALPGGIMFLIGKFQLSPGDASACG